MKQLDSELKEDQTVSNKQLVKENARIMEKLFYIYFKIITRNKISKYYRDALDGLLKYVHRINVDLIWNIIEYLKISCDKLRSMQDQQENRILCILAINNIITGPGQVFEIDELPVLTNLYIFVKDFYTKDRQMEDREQRVLLELLQNCFLKKRQLGNNIVASYIIMVSFLAVQQQDRKFKQTLVFFIHKCV